LARLDGLDYEEIAAELQVTVNHVGVLLNRARSALRERLEPHRPSAPVKSQVREAQS
jgi:DNA-directed RNA polymerase specialized sigma24 family protein